MTIKSPYRIHPGKKVSLSNRKTDERGPLLDKQDAGPVLERHCERLAKVQEVLYADQKRAVLIVLQGMDTAGKDGAIRHIFSGINPQGCEVSSFKVPTPLEERHDFLWRVHKQVPARGMIGIFNRSHYEDVLSPRVHKHISKKTVKQRLKEINLFEEILTESGVMILKFFLHISRKEQTERLQERIDDKDKQWKLSESDLLEREFWPGYVDAYEDLLSATSTSDAPWFVIPADHKWYRNLAISEILLDAMESLKLSYPEPTVDVSKIKL